MNLRTLRVLSSIVSFIISTTPARRKIARMQETDPKQAFDLAHTYIKRFTKNICRICGLSIQLKGLENIPEEACLFVANHSSYLDVIVMEELIPGGSGFVGKDGLEKIPGIADWMRLMRCLFLNRDDIRAGLQTINEAADNIKEGIPMFIFPEGTRSRDGNLLEFKGGSLKIAQKAKAPILPIAISGSADIYENNPGLKITPGLIKVTFGKPFYLTDLSREDKRRAAEYTQEIVAAMKAEQEDSDWVGTVLNY